MKFIDIAHSIESFITERPMSRTCWARLARWPHRNILEPHIGGKCSIDMDAMCQEEVRIQLYRLLSSDTMNRLHRIRISLMERLGPPEKDDSLYFEILNLIKEGMNDIAQGDDVLRVAKKPLDPAPPHPGIPGMFLLEDKIKKEMAIVMKESLPLDTE